MGPHQHSRKSNRSAIEHLSISLFTFFVPNSWKIPVICHDWPNIWLDVESIKSMDWSDFLMDAMNKDSRATPWVHTKEKSKKKVSNHMKHMTHERIWEHHWQLHGPQIQQFTKHTCTRLDLVSEFTLCSCYKQNEHWHSMEITLLTQQSIQKQTTMEDYCLEHWHATTKRNGNHHGMMAHTKKATTFLVYSMYSST